MAPSFPRERSSSSLFASWAVVLPGAVRKWRAFSRPLISLLRCADVCVDAFVDVSRGLPVPGCPEVPSATNCPVSSRGNWFGPSLPRAPASSLVLVHHYVDRAGVLILAEECLVRVLPESVTPSWSRASQTGRGLMSFHLHPTMCFCPKLYMSLRDCPIPLS